MRLIDADAIEIHEQLEPLGNGKYEYARVAYMDDIDELPTVEAETMNKEAWIYVYTQLKECPMFCGRYDATNGNMHFMHGIQTIMEQIAWNAGCYDEFANMFAENIQVSEKRREE